MIRHLVERLANGDELAPFVAEAAQIRDRAPTLNVAFGHESPDTDGLVLRLPPPTAAALRHYPWPGNT